MPNLSVKADLHKSIFWFIARIVSFVWGGLIITEAKEGEKISKLAEGINIGYLHCECF